LTSRGPEEAIEGALWIIRSVLQKCREREGRSGRTTHGNFHAYKEKEGVYLNPRSLEIGTYK